MADTNLLGNLQTFDHKNSDFTVFNERLNQFFVANSITEETKRKAILLNSLSEECYILVRNLCVPDLPENKTFSALVKILKEHFCPVKSYFAERLAFFSARRKSNEAVCDWAARLKSLASTCDFKTELNIVLRDIFVIGMNDNIIMDRLFEEDASDSSVTLAKLLKIAQAKESALQEHKSRTPPNSTEVYHGRSAPTTRKLPASTKDRPAMPGTSRHMESSDASTYQLCSRK